MKFHNLVKKCPWHFEDARDKFQKIEKCPWHVPVTFMPVTFPKCPWQFSKKCPWHRKKARDKSQKSNVTGIKKCHGKKKNTDGQRRILSGFTNGYLFIILSFTYLMCWYTNVINKNIPGLLGSIFLFGENIGDVGLAELLWKLFCNSTAESSKKTYSVSTNHFRRFIPRRELR